MQGEYCLFCDKDNKEKHHLIIENDLFYSLWDKNPVSNGHALIIPKKHIASFFKLTNNDFLQLYDLIIKTKKIISEKYSPDGYNVGLNEGDAAGQTINHLHIHIIPRYKNDVKNPRGGIRNIIPDKGNY